MADDSTALSDDLASRLSVKADQTSKEETATPAPAEAPVEASVEADAPAEASTSNSTASQLLQNIEHEVQVTLADQQADPNSPLYSAQSFEDLHLHPDLLKGVYKMGFQKPSKIQSRALPLLLQDPPQNMIGQSQSGTGKTAAFVLTMLSRIDFTQLVPQAICIAPSRELTRQIMDVVAKMAEFTEVKTFLATKGVRYRGSAIEAHLIVGTPGTILDIVRSRGVLDLQKIKVFVLDEADNMLDEGQMADQSINIKNMITKANQAVQIVLFSATFSETVRNFALRFAPKANEIRLKKEEVTLDAIKQFFMDCRNEQHKYEVLLELYHLLTIGQSIIFCKKRDQADEIARRMIGEGHKVTALHGQLDGAERDTVMDDFKAGKTKVLITTNVIARGIDVLQVNLVINYDMPTDKFGQPDSETYIHRIGRTGRFGRQGISINFVHDQNSFKVMQSLERTLGRQIAKVQTDDFDEMEATLKKALKG